MKVASEIPAGGVRSARAHGGVVWVFSLGAFASSGMARVLDPLLPRLEHEFGVSLSRAAWALTAFVVVYGLMQMVYGPLADRRGKLEVMRWTSICAALAALACALSRDSLPLLVIARGAAGAFCAASIPLAIAWIGDHVPLEQRRTALAHFMIGQMVGMASGQMLGGLAAEHRLWSWPFGFYALVYGVVAIALCLHADAPPAADPARVRMSPLDSLRAATGDARARLVLVASFAEGLSFIGAFAYLATHLHREGGLALSSAGLIIMGFSLGGVGFALSASRWLQRFDEPTLIVAGGGLAAAGMCLIAIMPMAVVAAPATVMAGLGFYMLHNALQAHATQMMPAGRGAAIALFATAFFLGQSAGVALLGWVAEQMGTLVTLLAGAAGIAGVAVWFRQGLAASQGNADESRVVG